MVEVEQKKEEHLEQEVIVELEELETIEEFDNIEGPEIQR